MRSLIRLLDGCPPPDSFLLVSIVYRTVFVLHFVRVCFCVCGVFNFIVFYIQIAQDAQQQQQRQPKHKVNEYSFLIAMIGILYNIDSFHSFAVMP